ncbi:MAG: hypothetical protein J6I84_03815 [Bacilli bacterium]|nr:hypothetical protein [Bacilli bacterium]
MKQTEKEIQRLSDMVSADQQVYEFHRSVIDLVGQKVNGVWTTEALKVVGYATRQASKLATRINTNKRLLKELQAG